MSQTLRLCQMEEAAPLVMDRWLMVSVYMNISLETKDHVWSPTSYHSLNPTIMVLLRYTSITLVGPAQ